MKTQQKSKPNKYYETEPINLQQKRNNKIDKKEITFKQQITIHVKNPKRDPNKLEENITQPNHGKQR